MLQRVISGISRFLVVGGDGFLGSALSQAIRLHGGNVTATSRRRIEHTESRVFLNLYDKDSIAKLDVSGCGIAFICAGVSKHASFDTTPLINQRILVANTIFLCSRLLDAGFSVVFLSTSAVFDGEQPYAAESADMCPATAYGHQKSEIEHGIMNLVGANHMPGTATMVRISKVLAPNVPIISDWHDSLSNGENIYPLSDLRISPVSLSYVVEGLMELACAREQGAFHLSGESDITYAELARGLVDQWGFPSDRVCPVTSKKTGVPLAYVPKHPSLGMARTVQLIGRNPQSLDVCISEVSRRPVVTRGYQSCSVV